MSIFFPLTLFNQPRCSTITEHKCTFFMLHTVAHIHSWRLPNATAVWSHGQLSSFNLFCTKLDHTDCPTHCSPAAVQRLVKAQFDDQYIRWLQSICYIYGKKKSVNITCNCQQLNKNNQHVLSFSLAVVRRNHVGIFIQVDMQYTLTTVLYVMAQRI